jgi:arabinogalactan oligomer/maltooligosaccharide transport system permease protein
MAEPSKTRLQRVLICSTLVMTALFLTLPVTNGESVKDITFEDDASQYRRVRMTAGVIDNASAYQIWFAGAQFNDTANATLHSTILVGNTSGLDRPLPGSGYDDCWVEGEAASRDEFGRVVISPTASNWTCDLTGLDPGVSHWFAVIALDSNGAPHNASAPLYALSATSEVVDIPPPAPDTTPYLIAIGGIALSLLATLFILRWRDAKDGRGNARHAHAYIAPALLALAILTFYPVSYGIWLSFTDAHQTHLGQQSLIGFSNFVTVLTASGFLRVTLFTLMWTVINVIFHVGLGLSLALLLNRADLRGRTAYRTCLLLPWAIPSYISVLVWRGMLQPDGLINDLLGTDLDMLSGESAAKLAVIMVNIWLGVPFMMMSLSGALQSIPQDMHEAAKVDGVSGWHRFRHLTLPNLKSALVPLSLLGFIWTFNMFNVIYLMTDGGPDLYPGEPGATDILITYVYDVAFRDGAYGLAAAWSVVIFAMLVTFSWYYMKKTNATEAVA